MELHDSHEWTLWQARRAVGELNVAPVAQHVPANVAPPVQVRRRKKHWAGSFQIRFSHWLKGDGERPCDLGYTRRDLIRHLEKQFSKGMSWANYAGNMPFKSKDVWVVDHIVPKILFNAADVQEAYALTNLRPLWIKQNMAKGGIREHLL